MKNLSKNKLLSKAISSLFLLNTIFVPIYSVAYAADTTSSTEATPSTTTSSSSTDSSVQTNTTSSTTTSSAYSYCNSGYTVDSSLTHCCPSDYTYDTTTSMCKKAGTSTSSKKSSSDSSSQQYLGLLLGAVMSKNQTDATTKNNSNSCYCPPMTICDCYGTLSTGSNVGSGTSSTSTKSNTASSNKSSISFSSDSPIQVRLNPELLLASDTNEAKASLYNSGIKNSDDLIVDVRYYDMGTGSFVTLKNVGFGKEFTLIDKEVSRVAGYFPLVIIVKQGDSRLEYKATYHVYSDISTLSTDDKDTQSSVTDVSLVETGSLSKESVSLIGTMSSPSYINGVCTFNIKGTYSDGQTKGEVSTVMQTYNLDEQSCLNSEGKSATFNSVSIGTDVNGSDILINTGETVMDNTLFNSSETSILNDLQYMTVNGVNIAYNTSLNSFTNLDGSSLTSKQEKELENIIGSSLSSVNVLTDSSTGLKYITDLDGNVISNNPSSDEETIFNSYSSTLQRDVLNKIVSATAKGGTKTSSSEIYSLLPQNMTNILIGNNRSENTTTLSSSSGSINNYKNKKTNPVYKTLSTVTGIASSVSQIPLLNDNSRSTAYKIAETAGALGEILKRI